MKRGGREKSKKGGRERDMKRGPTHEEKKERRGGKIYTEREEEEKLTR